MLTGKETTNCSAPVPTPVDQVRLNSCLERLHIVTTVEEIGGQPTNTCVIDGVYTTFQAGYEDCLLISCFATGLGVPAARVRVVQEWVDKTNRRTDFVTVSLIGDQAGTGLVVKADASLVTAGGLTNAQLDFLLPRLTARAVTVVLEFCRDFDLPVAVDDSNG